MDFPPFWTKATEDSFSAWGWSHQSLDDAKNRALASAKKVAAYFQANSIAPLNRYSYGGNRPMREEVLQEFKDSSGKLTAAITRNSYGCQVLNTSNLLFVDVDIPEKILHEGFLTKLFRGNQPSALECAQTAMLSQATQWIETRPDWNWRIYRTFAGFRLIATHALFEPESSTCDAAFSAMSADPLYRKLCKAQKSFRARLTPKPWRCGINHKPARWPWRDERSLKDFQRWLNDYETKSAPYATCQFITSIGSNTVLEEVKPLLAIHDTATAVDSGKPLA